MGSCSSGQRALILAGSGPPRPRILAAHWWRWNLVHVKSDLTRPQSSGGSDGKVSASSAGDPGSIPGSGRRPGEGNGDPVHYSCLENPMDRTAWQATVHGVTKSWTRLSTFIVQISYLPLTCAPLLWAPHHKANSRRGRLLWERSEHLTLASLSS